MKKNKTIDLINLALLPLLFFNFALTFYAPKFTLFALVYTAFGPILSWIVTIFSFIYVVSIIIFTFKKMFEQKHSFPRTARIVLIAVFIPTYLLLYSLLFNSLKPDDYSLLRNNTQFMLVQAGIIIVSIALACFIIKKIDFEKQILKVLVALLIIPAIGYYGFWLIGVILSAMNISLIIFSVLVLIIPIIFSYIMLQFHRFVKKKSIFGLIVFYYLLNLILFFIIALMDAMIKS
jgi:hypothetical protein